jgi:peptidyl-tRNA hydrolase
MKFEDEGDPIALYVIINEELNIGGGKIGGACGHIVEKIMDRYYRFVVREEVAAATNTKYQPDAKTIERANIIREWKNHGSRKITLKADSKEQEKLKEEFGEDLFFVQDAGHTQCAPGSITAYGVWPMRKSNRPKILKRLQAQE